MSLLIFVGPYPLAMVGSPDEGLSNTMPPKITLMALAIFQFGLLLSIEDTMRRVLNNRRLWTAIVLINSMIMTVYLWHITIMVILISLLYLGDGFGLGLEPGTTEWWLSRPLWVAVLYVLLLPVALLMSPFERHRRAADAGVPSAVRQVSGAMTFCLGIALLARYGYGGGPIQHLDIAAFALCRAWLRNQRSAARLQVDVNFCQSTASTVSRLINSNSIRSVDQCVVFRPVRPSNLSLTAFWASSIRCIFYP